MKKQQQKITKEILDEIPDLPSLPTHIRRIDQALGDLHSSTADIAKEIEKDPAISANVLKMANSALYGSREEIQDLERAIVRLGFLELKTVVLGSSVLKVFSVDGDTDQFDVQAFWKHSIGCGAAARVISKMANQDTGRFYLAGLVHDIGKIVLAKYFEEEFQAILEVVRKEDCLMYTAERRVLGVGHPQIGGVLMEKWNMDPKIVRSTYYHHHPSEDQKTRRFTTVIHLADLIVRSLMFGNGGDRRIPGGDQEALREIGLNSRTLRPLFQKTEEEIASARSFLRLIPD